MATHIILRFTHHAPEIQLPSRRGGLYLYVWRRLRVEAAELDLLKDLRGRLHVSLRGRHGRGGQLVELEGAAQGGDLERDTFVGT